MNRLIKQIPEAQKLIKMMQKTGKRLEKPFDRSLYIPYLETM